VRTGLGICAISEEEKTRDGCYTQLIREKHKKGITRPTQGKGGGGKNSQEVHTVKEQTERPQADGAISPDSSVVSNKREKESKRGGGPKGCVSAGKAAEAAVKKKKQPRPDNQ